MTRKYPTPEQILLLQTGVLDEHQARAAWDEWIDATNIDTDLGGASISLLALYGDRLARWDISHENMPRIRGLARYWWTRGQLHNQLGERVLRLFNDEVIPAIDLLRLTDGQVSAARGHHVPEILIPEDQIQPAMDLLRGAGWAMVGWVPESRLRLISGMQWVKDDNVFSLRWKLIDLCCWSGADDSLWKNGTQHLSAEDQFLRLCARANPRDPDLALWLADAIRVIETIDAWDSVIEAARARHMLPHVGALTELLMTQIGIEIPAALAEISGGKKGRSSGSRIGLICLWHRYRRHAREEAFERSHWRGFVRYVQFWIGLGRLRAVLVYLIRHGGRVDGCSGT